MKERPKEESGSERSGGMSSVVIHRRAGRKSPEGPAEPDSGHDGAVGFTLMLCLPELELDDLSAPARTAPVDR